jgi:hypothetical protein
MEIVKSNLLNILNNKKGMSELPFEAKNRMSAIDVVSKMPENISVDKFAELMVQNHLCPSLFIEKFKCKEQEYFAARCEHCWCQAVKYPNNI